MMGRLRPSFASPVPTANSPRSAAMIDPPDPRRGRASAGGGQVLAAGVLLLGMALFGLSAEAGLLLGQLAAFVATPLAVFGLWRGGLRKIVSLATLLGLVSLFAAFPDLPAAISGAFGGASNVVAGYLAVGACVVMAIVISGALARRLRNRLVADRPVAEACDRMLGALVGLAEASLLLLAICWIVTMVRPFAARLVESQGPDSSAMQAKVAACLLQLGEEASSGPIGEITRSTCVWFDVPALRQVIEDLNATGRLDLSKLRIDPQTAAQLPEALRSSPDGGLDALMEQYRRNAQLRDEAVRALPFPTSHGEQQR